MPGKNLRFVHRKVSIETCSLSSSPGLSSLNWDFGKSHSLFELQSKETSLPLFKVIPI